MLLRNALKPLANVAIGLCSGLAMLLALVVMFGWYAHSAVLVQVLHDASPMQFNNALGVFSGAAALLLHRRGFRRWPLAAAAVPLVLGAATLAEYLAGVDLGIDRLAVEPFIATKTVFPGRMSVNSAVAQMVLGAALLVQLVGRGRTWYAAISATIAAVLFGIAANALFGYLADIELASGWTRHSNMGLPAIAGFALISVGMHLLAWQSAVDQGEALPIWSALPVIVFCLLPTIWIFESLHQAATAEERRYVAQHAMDIAASIDNQTRFRIRTLARLGRRHIASADAPDEVWDHDARTLLGYLNGFLAVQALDRQGRVLRTARLPNWDLSILPPFNPDPPASQIDPTLDAGWTLISAPLEFSPGDWGFVAYVPVFDPTEFSPQIRGWTAGVIRYEELLQSIGLEAIRRDFSISVHDGSQVILAPPALAPSQAGAPDAKQRVVLGVPLPGRTWTLTAQLLSSSVVAFNTTMPVLVLLFGLLLTVAILLALGYARIYRRRSRELSGLNERLAAESAEVRRLEQRFRKVVDLLPSGLVVVNSEARITLVNAEVSRLFDYTPDELVGQPVEILVPEHHRDRHVQDRDDFIAEPQRRQMAARRPLFGRRKDGSLVPVDVALNYLELDSGHRIVAAVKDMSEHHASQAALQQANQSLERVNHELESFSYSVSHDLRAPLRAMTGFADLLLKEHSAQLDDNGRHYLTRIIKGAERMGQLIDDLLRLSRLTRSEFHGQEVDLSALAEQVITELRDADGSREVGVEIQPGLHTQGDASLLRVLMQNLLGNAWKFTGQVPEPRISLHSLEEEGVRVYCVRDNGAGFDMDYADKLFGAFQRLHRQEEFSGTGIGLATAQRVVARHNGTIWAEGAVGRGATFYFTLQGERESTPCAN